MKNLTFTVDHKDWTQVTKATARKLYNAGSEIMICAANMRPGGPWKPEVIIDKAYLQDTDRDPDFDKYVNAFTYYNCTPETGSYPRFYKAI